MDLDWKNLGFQYLPTRGHVISHFKNGKWSSPTFETNPIMDMHVASTNIIHTWSIYSKQIYDHELSWHVEGIFNFRQYTFIDTILQDVRLRVSILITRHDIPNRRHRYIIASPWGVLRVLACGSWLPGWWWVTAARRLWASRKCP